MSTVVILAGGMSRRMGRNKLELELDGETLLDSAVRRFSPCFEVYVSVADDTACDGLAVTRVPDIFPGLGPMAGLHAALTKTEDGGVFLLAADMPFAAPEAALKIISLAGDAAAAAVRYADGRAEPLFGFYKKTLLPELTRSLADGDYTMSALLRRIDTRFISPDELGALWNGRLLLNVNTPEDYARLGG
jgi:molybdopterin-guanine dinucleotide biosynthesis protein A